MSKHKITGGDLYAIFLKVLSIWMLIKATGYGNPPSFYSRLRVLVFLTAAYSIYTILKEFSRRKVAYLVFMLAIFLMFNPVMPIYLKKSTWRIIDLNSAFVFLMSILGLDIEVNGKPLLSSFLLKPFDEDKDD